MTEPNEAPPPVDVPPADGPSSTLRPATEDTEVTPSNEGGIASQPPWLALAPWIVLAIAALFFFAPLGKSGIWDPFELNVADLSRRIAINVFGARSLTLEGADNTMPKLGDLGRGELPFDSIAMGFRLFGLHEWSGRLPLAIWGSPASCRSIGCFRGWSTSERVSMGRSCFRRCRSISCRRAPCSETSS